MGWDAYAKVKGRDYDNYKIVDKTQQYIFNNAIENVKRNCDGGFVNSLLIGGLESSRCQSFLSKAVTPIGGRTYDDEWTAEQVRQFNKKAEWWRCDYDDDDKVFFYSAKYFLKACAKAGVGIKFSY